MDCTLDSRYKIAHLCQTYHFNSNFSKSHGRWKWIKLVCSRRLPELPYPAFLFYLCIWTFPAELSFQAVIQPGRIYLYSVYLFKRVCNSDEIRDGTVNVDDFLSCFFLSWFIQRCWFKTEDLEYIYISRKHTIVIYIVSCPFVIYPLLWQYEQSDCKGSYFSCDNCTWFTCSCAIRHR